MIRLAWKATERRVLLSAVVALVCFIPGNATAQQAPYVTVYEPIEWAREDGVVAMPAGALLRIRGLAFHPGGVRRVLIMGATATLEDDPSGAVNFSGFVNLAAGLAGIEIVLEPNSGDAFRRTFPLNVEGGAPTPPAAPAQAAASAATPMNPSGALVGGLLLPGLGQYMTRRPGLGVLLTGAAGAAIIGSLALSSPGKLECDEFGCTSIEKRKNFVPLGVGAAAVIALIGAIEARGYAIRHNAGLSSGGDGTTRLSVDLAVDASRADGSVQIRLLRWSH